MSSVQRLFTHTRKTQRSFAVVVDDDDDDDVIQTARFSSVICII